MLVEQETLYVLLLNALISLQKTKTKKLIFLLLAFREEHGIPTLMMVGNKETASTNANQSIAQSMPSSSLREPTSLFLVFLSFPVLI